MTTDTIVVVGLVVGAVLVALALGTVALGGYALWKMNRAIERDQRGPEEE